MGSSALLRRRLISGILRSRGDASSYYSPCRGFVANRTIITNSNRWISGVFRSESSSNSPCHGVLPNQRITNRCISGVSSSNMAAAPWLMLESQYCDWRGDWTYRFHSFAEAQTYTFLINRRGECFRPNMLGGNVVGSSHGWIALHDVWDEMNNLYLSDPTAFRLIDLPPVEPTARLRSLILDRRSDGRAFVIISKSGLAFCSPGRSRSWILFSSGSAYESLIYSSHHRRLFSLTSAFDLEVWDVGSEQPRLERAIRLELGDQRPELTRVVYLVCAEDCGDLFVVVRYVKTGRRFWDDLKCYVGPTVDFEVYKLDPEREKAVKMEGSLEGMTMFVGMNHPVAVMDWRLRPDSIYFAYDKQGCYYEYDGMDVGIFDYEEGKIYPIDISHPLNKALWFAPAI